MPQLYIRDWVALVMASSLGLICVTCAIGLIVLPMQGHDIPPSLAALSGSCAGYLATYLGVLLGRASPTNGINIQR